MAVRNNASTEEVLVVLVIAGLIAAAISYSISSKQAAVAAAQQPKVIFVKPDIVKKPVFSDVGPGWGSGRWLGHGDFVFRHEMDHPYGRLPRYSGHPSTPAPPPQAPPMRMPMPPPGMPAFGFGPSA
jgi:hypothetical protein